MVISFKDFLKENLTLQYHNKLNPKLWKKDQLKQGIAEHLLELAFAYASFSHMPRHRIKDIVITGGNVNFNYTKLSDIDVHLLCDTGGFSSDDLFEKKREWTHQHNDIVAGYPVELFCVDYTEVVPKGQGVYSILNNRWVIVPKHLDDVSVLKDPFVEHKIKQKIKYIKHLIKSGTTEEIEKFKTQLHNGRAEGLHSVGEFSIENVIYKDLRNRGWLDKLNNSLTETYHEEEGGTFEDEGVFYDINKIFDITENLPVESYPVKKLKWIVPHKIKSYDAKRADKTDVTVPIIVTNSNGKLLVVDGYHRLLEAIKLGLTELPGKFISKNDLLKTKLKDD